MEYRQLGSSGLKVSALTLGTMTFGGAGPFAKVGSTDVQGARRQIDMCRDAGITLIDTADVYSSGLSEEILGEALEGRRNDFLVATKVRFPMGEDPNMRGPIPPPHDRGVRGQPAAACGPTTSTSTRCTSGMG